MTLLLAVAAACVATLVWYMSQKARKMKIGTLALMYWGASLMWLVDAVVEYLEQGAAFFQPAAEDMQNDAYLGCCVIALGVVIWLIELLATDPLGTVRAILNKSTN